VRARDAQSATPHHPQKTSFPTRQSGFAQKNHHRRAPPPPYVEACSFSTEYSHRTAQSRARFSERNSPRRVAPRLLTPRCSPDTVLQKVSICYNFADRAPTPSAAAHPADAPKCIKMHHSRNSRPPSSHTRPPPFSASSRPRVFRHPSPTTPPIAENDRRFPIRQKNTTQPHPPALFRPHSPTPICRVSSYRPGCPRPPT
jgi:hypothetical protein